MRLMTRDLAKQLNLKRYYTGMFCVRGHDAPRYTLSGACTLCAKINHVMSEPDSGTDQEFRATRLALRKLANSRERNVNWNALDEDQKQRLWYDRISQLQKFGLPPLHGGHRPLNELWCVPMLSDALDVSSG